MIARLQKLEALNISLRSEIREKTEQVHLLKDQNKKLTMAASSDAYEQIAKVTLERDDYKNQVSDMKKFLSDYGLKWVGGEGGQQEGKFDSKAINEELKF